MNIYFVYIYKDPISGVPFYVGYGKNTRHLDHLKEATRKPFSAKGQHKLNTIRELLRNNLTPIIQIIMSDLTKAEACELEEFLIAEIGRRDLNTGPLTNLTCGGDGNRGWSPEQREKTKARNCGLVSAKDPITGQRFKVPVNDPRWVAGDLVGHNAGRKFSMTKNSGFIMARDQTGTVFKVHCSDPRWVSGELVGINKGKPAHQNTIAAAKNRKGTPKTKEHNKKVSETAKLLVWYFNAELNQVRRFKEDQQLPGYVRVSGPHKRIPL